jgi:hypothetical protein
LYVGEQGVAFNHHFLLPNDGVTFKFLPGRYTIELFAARVDHPKPQLLWSTILELSQGQVETIDQELGGGVFFEWQPNSENYARVGSTLTCDHHD